MNTITLKTAKKLYELAKEKGVKLPESEYRVDEVTNIYAKDENTPVTTYKTYTTDELLEWLPEGHTVSKIETKNGKKYVSTFSDLRIIFTKRADIPAEALGLLAIELIKRGLTK